jgi:hypothetical protein
MLSVADPGLKDGGAKSKKKKLKAKLKKFKN